MVRLSRRRFAAFLIVVIPILDMYSFPFIIHGLSTVLMFLLVVVLFLCPTCNRSSICKEIFITKDYCKWTCLIVFFLGISLIIDLEVGINYRKLLSIILMLLIFYLISRNKVDGNIVVKYYLVAVSVACAYIFCQFIFAKALGLFLPNIVLPIKTIGSVFDAQIEMRKLGVLRLSSFFSEPAVFAQYVIPGICIMLYKSNKKKKCILYAAAYTIAIMISTSSLGIVLATLAWGIFLYSKYKAEIIKCGALLFPLIILLGIAVMANPYMRESLISIFGKIGQANSKTGERVYRGFAVFLKLPSDKKLFGIGLGNAQHYIQTYGIRTKYDSQWYENYDYYNGISSAMLYGGLLCCVSFVMAPLSIIRKKTGVAGIIAILFIAMSFGSSTFFNTAHVFYGAIMLCAAASSSETVYRGARFETN